LLVRRDRRGRETWYGKWRTGERQVMRALGPRRQPGDTLGLTRRQAELELRRLMGEETARPIVERLTLETLAPRYLAHKETIGLRRSTLRDYASHLRVHLIPFFGRRSLDAVTPAEVEAFIRVKLREGKSRKTVDDLVGLLSAMYRYAVKRGQARLNPVELADRPRQTRTDADIRYLTVEELEALLRAVLDDELGRMERVLYLTAAMTGMRRGECVALRWRDVDWASGVIRVRRSYGDGEFGPPKTRRSSRAVPMADRVAAELERLHQRSPFRADDDLVFCHPLLGGVYDPSKLRKRFVDAARRAGIRPVRFHDLRHTFGTQMAAAGAPLRAIQEWMGHSDYRTTSIYADYAPDPSQGALYAAKAFGPPSSNTALPPGLLSPANADGGSRPQANVRSPRV
jgi:integrase